MTEDRATLTIAILNPSDTAAPTKLAVIGGKLADHGRLWRMAQEKADAAIRLEKAPEVFVEERDADPIGQTILVPPYSVNLYSFSVVK